ncbi:MAG: hypothetical protein ACREEB_11415 [Caulobacteraceae bacterium]
MSTQEKSEFIWAISRISHSMDPETKITSDVDMVTGNYRVVKVPKYLEPGAVYAVTPALAAELLTPRPVRFGGAAGDHPPARRPTTDEMALFRSANPEFRLEGAQ